MVELSVFGLSAIHLSSIQFSGMLEWSTRRDALQLQAVIKNAHMATMLLIFAYAMLIPNTWRSATRVIGILALVPVATAAFVLFSYPEVRGFVRDEAILRQTSTNLSIMLFAGALSAYGVYILDSLRHEACEAKRLNQYQLGRLLGAGGMGEVYLAEHRLLKRQCAVKLVNPDDDDNPDALARFEFEVRSAARLSHPNIVEVYDYGHSEDGRFYYVMEYLHGQNLEEMVAENGPLAVSRAVDLLCQTCDGLMEAHAAGLIHRDLKPGNVFVANIGARLNVAKLLDFGLVKDLAQPTPRTYGISGTPNYMAPEQATGSDELDHRADIYGLGGVAYYLLTGQPPFQASSALAAVVAHTSRPVLPPTELRSDIPARLEQVIMKCLAKKPEQRFSDAQHLKAALIDCLKEEELRKAVRQQAGSSGSQATSAAPAANALVEWIASKS